MHFHLLVKANTFTGDASEFLQHHHPYCEIYIYLGGKARFFLEGTTFDMNPCDIIVVPPYTLHQPQSYTGECFERIVLNVLPNFFEHMDCPEYQNMFSYLSSLTAKIPGHIVKRSDMMNFINFVLRDYDKNNELMKPLLMCKVVELLYQINTNDSSEKYDSINQTTQDIYKKEFGFSPKKGFAASAENQPPPNKPQ